MSNNTRRRLRDDGRHEFSHKYIVDIFDVKKRGETEHGNFLGYVLAEKQSEYECPIHIFLTPTISMQACF